MNVKQGQVWRDNYQPAGGSTRFIKVVKASATKCSIQRVNEDGSAIARSPLRETATKRFNGKKDGFTLHRDENGAVVTAEQAKAASEVSAPVSQATEPAAA